jgi:hypothetical protein
MCECSTVLAGQSVFVRSPENDASVSYTSDPIVPCPSPTCGAGTHRLDKLDRRFGGPHA